jgi:hypothetical protein
MQVRLLLGEVALEQDFYFPKFFGFPLLIIIPSLLHTICAVALTRQHTTALPAPELRASSLSRHVAGLEVKTVQSVSHTSKHRKVNKLQKRKQAALFA